MLENRSIELKELALRLSTMEDYLHIEDKSKEIVSLEEQASRPGFWDKRDEAQAVMSKASVLREEISSYRAACERLADIEAGLELAYADDDEDLESEMYTELDSLIKEVDDLELASWLDGEFDHGDAIVSINPGAGGLEAQDWTEMLFRMLNKYAERKGWKVTINDIAAGEGIGLDHVTFTVSGKDAYGMLRSEDGVHRLVRISPTDEKKRRHTTFAAVQVLPVIPDTVEVAIDQNDLRIDVFHASGHGGQGVNTTDSAVRITHFPSGIVVTCQNERSQLQNKETAMRILKSRLYEIELQKRADELDELRGDKRHIEFGSQIRNYVLYPYQLVKDVRSAEETGNVEAVLAGDIDRFVVAYHRMKVSNKKGS